jgi:ferric-dicitrate binding protein FerR (iron transport regulator)
MEQPDGDRGDASDGREGGRALMFGHVAPHRWADALAGRLAPRDVAAMATHADRCERCALARDRIGAAQATYADLRTEPAPEMKWDQVRAQAYWETQSQLRLERVRARPRTTQLSVPIAAIAGIAALVIAVASGSVPRKRVGRQTYITAVGPVADPDEIGALTLVRGDVTVDGTRALDAFAHSLGTGSEIRTGSGDVSVQFGPGSAFAVGPRSVLRMRQFDRKAIALEIDGRIDVDVAPRAPGQRFAVIAGHRTIEVRGTGFRVERAGDTVVVQCRHGRVAVIDDGGELELRAGQGVELAAGVAVRDAKVKELETATLAALAHAAPHRLAVWAAPDAVTAMTAPLSVMAAPGRGVRVDGTEVGAGPLTVRVVAGRHLVETAEIDGDWVSAGWVDVRQAPIEVAAIEDEPVAPPRKVDPAKPDLRRARKLRGKQLQGQLGSAAHCLRTLRKQGIADTFLSIELQVDARGAVRFANVVDTDLPTATADCVREAVVQMQFPPGPSVTWRETIQP